MLPYVKTAREGVQRLGALLEEFGTYEMNGVAFSDSNEIWWLETVGGHHWIAKRVPDEAYVTMPNQLGIDEFDLEDALGDQEAHMCSEDLAEFIETNHLDLAVENTTPFNPRDAFAPTPTPTTCTTPRAPGTCSASSTRTTRCGTARTPTTSPPPTTSRGPVSLSAR